jgi:hypothetical protein
MRSWRNARRRGGPPRQQAHDHTGADQRDADEYRRNDERDGPLQPEQVGSTGMRAPDAKKEKLETAARKHRGPLRG